MKICRNVITGSTIETDGALSGKNWELVETKKKKRKSAPKKKQTATKKEPEQAEEVTEVKGEE